MKKYDLYSGIFLGGISIITCILSYRLGLGEIHNPGPGLIPFGVAGILFLMSLGLIIRCVIEKIKSPLEGQVFKDVAWERVILVLISLLGYGIGFNHLGFSICTFLLIIFLLGFVGRQAWWFTILTSLLIVAIGYFIFIVWLDIPFPKGPFGI